MFYIVFELNRVIHISATVCLIEMGFGSKSSIFNGQQIYIENPKLNIADMWPIPLDRVTYSQYCEIVFRISVIEKLCITIWQWGAPTGPKIWIQWGSRSFSVDHFAAIQHGQPFDSDMTVCCLCCIRSGSIFSACVESPYVTNLFR